MQTHLYGVARNDIYAYIYIFMCIVLIYNCINIWYLFIYITQPVNKIIWSHWIYVRMLFLVVFSIYVPILVSVALIGSDTFEVRFLLLHHPLMGFKQCYILIIRTYATNQSTRNKTTTILIIEKGVVMHTTYFPP